MARKTDPVKLQNAVQLYIKGCTVPEASRQSGVSKSVILRALQAHGIDRISKHERSVAHIDRKEVERLHLEGIGVGGIAERLNSSPSPITKILHDLGHKPRNRTEQQFARMARTDSDARKKLVAKANEAARGRKASSQELVKRAQARSRIVSAYETKLAAALRDRGVAFSTQTPIGPYNCDFTIGSIAVEVWGGGWHFTGNHAAVCEKRFHYIANAGYSIIVLCVDKRRPVTAQVADNLIREIELASNNPASVRQYRMIWGAGEFATTRSLDDDHFTIEPPFTRTRDARTGRYKAIAR